MLHMTTTKKRKPAPNERPRLYRGASGQQRQLARRAQLLAAATRLYGTAGYAATTMKAVCAEAKLTERYFYESFTNTEELLCQAYSTESAQLRAQINAAILAVPATPEARARAGLSCYFEAIAARPDMARLLLIEITGVCARGDTLYREDMHQSAELVVRTVFDDLPRAKTNSFSPLLLATGFMGAIYQLARERLLSGYKTPTEVLVAHGMVIFLGILGQLQQAEH